MRKIILASTSPRRKELLKKVGLIFDIVPSNYEEDMTLPMPPDELVKFLSKGKAESVAQNYDDALIIGADTIVFLNGHVLGKAYTKEGAKEMLEMLSGKEHSVFTGYTIIDTKNKKIVSEAIEEKIKFKDLSEKEINEYIATEEPLTRGGAYAIQTVGKTFIENTVRNYDCVVGLPVDSLIKKLKLFNIQL